MIYITSDSHYWHGRIIQYCNRPFSNVEEMNESLIENYNKVVRKGDLVFHLGDFAFQVSNKREEIKEIVRRLNGKLICIKGNHDSGPKLKDLGIQHVYTEAYLTIGGISLHLNHFPIVPDRERDVNRPECKRPKARMPVDLSLCGHKHSIPSNVETRDNWGKLICLDVGVDGRADKNYTPWSWEEILDRYNG